MNLLILLIHIFNIYTFTFILMKIIIFTDYYHLLSDNNN